MEYESYVSDKGDKMKIDEKTETKLSKHVRQTGGRIKRGFAWLFQISYESLHTAKVKRNDTFML